MSQEQETGRFVTWPEYLKGHLERANTATRTRIDGSNYGARTIRPTHTKNSTRLREACRTGVAVEEAHRNSSWGKPVLRFYESQVW
jgi:hypothetical protein